MKKTLSILSGLALSCLIANTSFATDDVDVAQTAAGDPVQITISVSGAPTPMTFNPSTNVNIDGTTSPTSFAINGWHDSAAGKDAGQRYGMAADVNKLFFIDISGTPEPADVGGTVSTAAFSGWTTL